MKIVWFAPYDVLTLEPELKPARRLAGHSCSWIVNLSLALADIPGIDLQIVTESPLVKQHTVVEKNNITYHVLKSGIPFTNRGYPSYFKLDLYMHYAPNIRRIVSYVDTLKPDIVHAYGTENAYALAASKSTYPFIVSMQGILNHILEKSTRYSDKLKMTLERNLVKEATYFDCRTNLDEAFIRKWNPNAKVFTIHRAIHPAFFEVDWEIPTDYKLLFVGTVLERKGIETLISALENVAKIYPQIQVNVAGSIDAGYRSQLNQLEKSSGIAGKVHYLGHQTTSQIARLHAESRLLVFPSFMDNSPNGLAEAMVSGLPSIASRVGGIPSMVENGKTGILFEVGNAEKLAEGIIELLQDTEKSRRISNEAKEVARERHLPANVATKILQAYHQIINLKAPALHTVLPK